MIQYYIRKKSLAMQVWNADRLVVESSGSLAYRLYDIEPQNLYTHKVSDACWGGVGVKHKNTCL